MIEHGADVDRRDHVGRTPLQLSILSKAEDIACDLVDANARMTSRLVDGRTALHLAAQLDMPKILRKLLERSVANAEEARKLEEEAKHVKKASKSVSQHDEGQEGSDNESDSSLRDSSEDDWSSEEEVSKKTEGESYPLAIPEDDQDVPDVFDLNIQDWDYSFTALNYAVVGGASVTVGLLLAAGAELRIIDKLILNGQMRYSHPLALTSAIEDEDVACKIAQQLLAAGAVSSEADEDLYTVFHRIVCSARPYLVSALLRADPNARAVINSPATHHQFYDVIFPIVSVILTGSYSTLAVLLAHGANAEYSPDDLEKAIQMT